MFWPTQPISTSGGGYTAISNHGLLVCWIVHIGNPATVKTPVARRQMCSGNGVSARRLNCRVNFHMHLRRSLEETFHIHAARLPSRCRLFMSRCQVLSNSTTASALERTRPWDFKPARDSST